MLFQSLEISLDVLCRLYKMLAVLMIKYALFVGCFTFAVSYRLPTSEGVILAQTSTKMSARPTPLLFDRCRLCIGFRHT